MGMTLEEAVKHAEEVAEKCEFDTDWGMGNHFIDRSEVTDIIKCGEEHRQLAEWLKELKYYREKSEEQTDIESVKSFLSDYCRENDIYVISHDVINEDNYHYSIHILTEEITETEHRCGTRIELRKKQGDTAEWKKISPAGIYECTKCGQKVMTSDISAYKHCHGCGRRMKGAE